MTQELFTLALGAGFLHAIIGVDHYLPFVAMSHSGKWSSAKTMQMTFLCGLAHTFSAFLLGIAGLALGFSLTQWEAMESLRGNLAAWMLIAFGLLYLIWGLRQVSKNKVQRYWDINQHRPVNEENKDLHNGLLSYNTEKSAVMKNSPWVIFTIFVLGPCEPLIPLIMYAGAKNSSASIILTAGIFSTATILTMIVTVAVLSFGINLLPLKKIKRYSYAIAGAAIFLSGIAIQFLGF